MNTKNNIFLHKHICLLEDHYNPLGIVRSLGEAGIKPIVLLCCSHKPHLVNKSKYIGELHTFSSINDGYDFLITHYGKEELKPFLYNGGDSIALLLDNHYEELKDNFYFSNGRGGLKKLLNKYEITLLAKDCGVDVPREAYLKKGDLPNNLRYPIITKASTSAMGGNWKADSFVCNTPEELQEAYKKIKSKNVLVQEFVNKENEYCVDGISINGGEEVFMPYAASYLRLPKDNYGGAMWLYPINNKELDVKIKKIIRKSNYTGIFCIEFLMGEDGKYYFLEVNFRNSGWSYAYTKNGFNLLTNWAKATLENSIDVSDFTPNPHFTAIAEVDDFQKFVYTKQIGILKWIRELKNADCLFLWNKEDPRPGNMIIIKMIFSQLLRNLGLKK